MEYIWKYQEIKKDKEMRSDKYKISKYNLYFSDDTLGNFIWNSVTDVLQNVDKDEYDCICSENYHHIAEGRIEYFRECGFLIDHCVDETEEIIRQMSFRVNHGFPHYRILTTTACNAACTYCYEKGCTAYKMTYETADKVATFIHKHSNAMNSMLEWFGGEPLMNPDVIDIICRNLRRNGMRYQSVMESNGLLFIANLFLEL